jgi:hypothetical protein
MDILTDIYKYHFNDTPEVDDTLKEYLLLSNWQSALEYCYSTERVNIFKCLYLYTDCKFNIDFMVQMEQIIATEMGNICKPRWNGKWMELEVTNIILSEENKKKYGKKMDMIRFIANCRSYSRHIYTGCKFYYYFKRDKYEDRIRDILREM